MKIVRLIYQFYYNKHLNYLNESFKYKDLCLNFYQKIVPHRQTCLC